LGVKGRIFKQRFKKWSACCLRYDPTAAYSKHDNEPSVSIKDGEFYD
jgi:hypothetical protein